MNAAFSPFHESLAGVMPNPSSPLQVMRFIRYLMNQLDASQLEVEIIMGLCAQEDPADMTEIRDIASAFARDQVDKIVKRMVRVGLLDELSDGSPEGLTYQIKPIVAQKVKSVDRISIQ